MLVLTRKADEQILIGDNIKITLIRVRGNSVRIGIEAPREMRVIRGELQQREIVIQDQSAAEELADEPIDDLAEIFAHPEDFRPGRTTKSASAPSADRNVANRLSVTATDTQLFVGSVRPCGSQAKLRRAPLADFVSAG